MPFNKNQRKLSTREKISDGFLVVAAIFVLTSIYALFGCIMSNFHPAFLVICASALVIASILAIIGRCIRSEKLAPAPNINYQPSPSESQMKQG